MLKNIDDVLHDLIEHWLELKFIIDDEGLNPQIIYGQLKELYSSLIVFALLTDKAEPFYLNRKLIEIVSIIDLGIEKPSIEDKSRLTV
ncbi:MAG: hypothetical protein H3Z53_04745 [archaeon]|nr:hypothetical protein [archaeon]MCP8313666.1 hypothetical protein [archaeon]